MANFNLSLGSVYPGKSATFVHSGGDWEPFDPIGDLYRRMDFKAETEGALITKFSIFGYTTGSIKTRIVFDKVHAKNIDQYFLNQRISLEFYELSFGWYYTTREKEHQSVFQVLKANNTFPPEYLSKIEDVVKAGRTDPIVCEKRFVEGL